MSKYNVLYLHCHDAGRYIEPYGYKVSTPNLQRLAEEGMLFRQAHCANPTCSPSRAALLTGQAAHSSGMLGLAHRGWTLNDYGQTWMSVLRAHGYQTVLTGQQHITHHTTHPPEVAGYSEVMGTDNGFDSPPQLVEEFLSRRPQDPFFLDVGFHAPHRTGRLGDFKRRSEPKDDRYLMPPPTLPDTPETRRDFALYSAAVEDMDQSMGRVLESLDRHGYRDNTLVICTTDHGIAFPHMKCRLTDHGTGVMLMLRGPGGFSGGRVTDALVSHIDLFPTLCDVLDIEHPDWLQGHSLRPLVRGEVDTIRDAVFAEVNYHASAEPMRSVRTPRWKYIRNYDGYPSTVLPNIDNGASKQFLYDAGLGDRVRPAEELYDCYFDPQEVCNRAQDESCAAIRQALAARLDKWMRETDDPLVNGGPLPVCPDMVLTDPGTYDP